MNQPHENSLRTIEQLISLVNANFFSLYSGLSFKTMQVCYAKMFACYISEFTQKEN